MKSTQFGCYMFDLCLIYRLLLLIYVEVNNDRSLSLAVGSIVASSIYIVAVDTVFNIWFSLFYRLVVRYII